MKLERADVRRCVKCVLPETYPGLVFDEHGVCSMCREFKPPVVLGEDRLREAIEKTIRPKERYDCIVQLSGGRDSTFVLHYAVRELGLRVLACAVDNGCIPEETHENIRNAVSILGVDIVVEAHDLVTRWFPSALSVWFERPTAALLATLCTGCRRGLDRCLRNMDRGANIQLSLNGGGEPEKSFAMAFFTTSRRPGVRTLQLVRGMTIEFLRSPGYRTRPLLLSQFLLEFGDSWLSPVPMQKLMLKLRGRTHHRCLELFRYIPWNERQIMDTITNELHWKRYRLARADWRSDCKIAVLRNYFNHQLLGFSKHDELVSNMIRQGVLTRDEGLRRVEQDNDMSEDDAREICAELKVQYDDKWRTRVPGE